jgi:spore coat protein U-like protein
MSRFIKPAPTSRMIRLVLAAATLLLFGSKAEAQTSLTFGCTVTATSVAFETFTGSQVDSTGTIRLICFGRGSDNPYAVSLSEGFSNSFLDRLMLRNQAELHYNLYLDPTRRVIWGNGRGETQQFVGNLEYGILGTARPFLTVYGRIPAQRPPSPGAYADQILVIVTF